MRVLPTMMLVLGLVAATVATAEELSLGDAIDYAQRNAPTLERARRQVQASGLHEREALSELFPRVVFLVYTVHDDYVLAYEEDGGSTSEQGQQIRLDFAPEGLVGSYFSYRGAGAIHRVDEEELKEAIVGVSLNVIKAFYALEEAERDLDLRARLAAVHHGMDDRVRSVDLTLQLMDAEEAHIAAQVRLATVLGHPGPESLVAGEIDLAVPYVEEGTESLRPRGTSQAQIDAARAMVSAAKSEFLPEPFLRVDFSLSGDAPVRDPLEITRTSGSYFVLAGLQLDLINLYQAKLRRQQADLRLRNAQNQARTEVRTRGARVMEIRSGLERLARRRSLLLELDASRDARSLGAGLESILDQARLDARLHRLDSEEAVLRWELAFLTDRIVPGIVSDKP